MKEVLGNLWFTKDATNDSTNIGFTKQFIDERLSECFHVLMADTKIIKEKGPLLVLETNDGLEPVRSPLAGRIVFFNDKARNFPDRLLESDIIVSLSHKEPAKKATPSPYYDIPMLQEQFNAGPQQAQAQPALRRRSEPPVPIREVGMDPDQWSRRVRLWTEEIMEIRNHNRMVDARRIELQRQQANAAAQMNHAAIQGGFARDARFGDDAAQ